MRVASDEAINPVALPFEDFVGRNILRPAQRQPIRKIRDAQSWIRVAQLCHCILSLGKSSGKRMACCGFTDCDE